MDVRQVKFKPIIILAFVFVLCIPLAGACWNYRNWAYTDFSATKGRDQIMDPEWDYTLTRRKNHGWLPGTSEYSIPITPERYKQLETRAVRTEEVDGSGWWITIYF